MAEPANTADGNTTQWSQESAGQLTDTDQRSPDERQADQDDAALVQEVRENLAFVETYESAQRKAEEEQEVFEGEDMWRAADRESRDEFEDADGGKVPARPALSVPLHEQHLGQIVNEVRQARLSLTVKPKTGIAQTKTGEYAKGLMRTIQNESGALSIRVHGVSRAAAVGRGVYKLDAKFANDDDFDIDVVVERIQDQSSVFMDPYRQRADNEDMGWCICYEKISERDRLRRFPNKPIIPPGTGWIEKDAWFSVEGENKDSRQVGIATYDRVEFTEYDLGHHPQWGTGPLEKMPPEIQQAVRDKAAGTRIRTVQKRRIGRYVVDGTQVLSRSEWRGRYIPYIGVVGREYFLQKRRRYKGVIASAMDILQAINVVLSSAIEVAGQMPRAPYIMYEGQDAGFEEQWDNLPTRNYTRVYIQRESIDGKPAPFPQRQMLEPAIQGLMLLLRVLQDFFHSVTGGVAPQARAVSPYDRSGKAIEALQRQGAAGSSNYLDNLATISMPYEGKAMLSAIAGYYDRPGRTVRVSSDDEDGESAIMIKQPFVRDGDGTPIPVPCPQCQGRGAVPASKRDLLVLSWKPKVCPACEGAKLATKASMPETYQDQTVEYVDFSEVEFTVVPAIDRNYQAKQEEALAGMSDLAKAAPELVPAYAATWVRSMGFSGANKVADAIEAAFPTPGKEFGDHEKVPPRALQEIVRLRQEHEAAMQALDEATKIIETDQVKALQAKDLEVLRQSFQAKLEAVKVNAKILEQHGSVKADSAMAMLKGQIERMMQESEHRHEVVMLLLKERGAKEVERHEAGIHAEAESVAHARLQETGAVDHARTLQVNEQKAGHAERQLDKKGDQALTQSEVAHEQTLESQAQAAKLAPKPEKE